MMPALRGPTVAVGLAVVLAGAASEAADLPGGGRAYVVGPECRVRAEGPVDCDPIEHARHLVREPLQLQVVVEAGAEPIEVVVDDPRIRRLEEQLFVPVRVRSRGRQPGEALPWSAAARPPDDDVLGAIADPLAHRGRAANLVVPRGQRRALWVTLGPGQPGTIRMPIVRRPAGAATITVETLAHPLVAPGVSVFAYLERDEPRLADASNESLGCRARPVDRAFAARELGMLLLRHQILPVDRATTAPELAALQLGLRDLSVGGAAHDLVVLGAYGSLGEPTDDALARVEAMAAAVPDDVRDVVLYAIDEACESDLGPRWRARLRAAGGAAGRVKVLVTCSEDPTTIDADVVMTTAERFRPDLAARARAQGKEVWVYNGRLPQAGPMALDAPAEAMTWLGWIAARYDVRRWFLWNVNHWSDGNRGGLGPRDPYVDPETFHNADGDAVLLDGLLVFPPDPRTCSPDEQPIDGPPRASPLVRSARLARVQRGLHDAALLAVAAAIDPATAAAALDVVVPRALGEVADDEPTPLGDHRAIARARAMLHDAVARAAPREPGDEAVDPLARHAPGRAGLIVLRARREALARVTRGEDRGGVESSRVVAASLAVAACLVALVIAALRLARRRAGR